MQFALEVAILKCSFLNHSQGILGVKIFHTYVRFILHPQSLDGRSPQPDSCQGIGFLKVYTTIANAPMATTNTLAGNSLPNTLTIEQVANLIIEAKAKIKYYIKQDIE
jgi:hypothetical protein